MSEVESFGWLGWKSTYHRPPTSQKLVAQTTDITRGGHYFTPILCNYFCYNKYN
jgi:hypothetical protein